MGTMARNRIIRLVAVVLCGAATVALTACEPLSEAELHREVESIHSLAAEGSVLARQVAAQDTKRIFARVQAGELSDAAEHSAERLTDAHPAEGLDDATGRAIDLAERTSSAIGEIETAPDDAPAAARTTRQLELLADLTDSLAESL